MASAGRPQGAHEFGKLRRVWPAGNQFVTGSVLSRVDFRHLDVAAPVAIHALLCASKSTSDKVEVAGTLRTLNSQFGKHRSNIQLR
jgi:hypothetical protein